MRPNWLRTASVDTTIAEPSGSVDAGVRGIRSAPGKPSLASAVHIAVSQATMALRSTWAATQLGACCRSAAAGESAAAPPLGALPEAWAALAGLAVNPPDS